MDSISDELDYTGVYLIGGFVLLLLIGFLVFFISKSNFSVQLNAPCNANTPCMVGTICESGLCKSDIGQPCLQLSDCVASATSCLNSICSNAPLGTLDDSCPCAS